MVLHLNTRIYIIYSYTRIYKRLYVIKILFLPEYFELCRRSSEEVP